ncbi:hypothetical protein [Natrononativus amylolyticus]|uniref:hypothetical protein n=1 Tax=Natrononativus amylolyticus TaxID=2963434 RepID=UPI0020CEB213|nr:hypothetical protein [Natrononativus amylolyticus]
MTCPYLEYRDAGDGKTFDVARAYCTAAGEFVQPMRADICNDRFALEHTRDCEIYLAHEGGRAEADGRGDGGGA